MPKAFPEISQWQKAWGEAEEEQLQAWKIQYLTCSLKSRSYCSYLDIMKKSPALEEKHMHAAEIWSSHLRWLQVSQGTNIYIRCIENGYCFFH